MALPGSPPTPAPKPVAPKPKPSAKASPAKKKLAAAAAAPASGAAATTPANPYQAQAQSEIDPIIAAITAAATGQAQSADQAIQGLTNSYAQGIAGINYGAPYSSAEGQQAAVDAALQQSATGQGSNLAAALQARLAALQGSSGAGAVQQEANALASQGAGIGTAQLATGSAAENQLIADAAAANNYGNAMSGVIRSAGLQGIAQSEGQAQQAINQGTLQAESQLPQIEQDLAANKLQAQATAAQIANYGSEAAYRNAEIAAKDAGLSLTARKDAASIAQGNARVQQGAVRNHLAALRLSVERNQGQQRINIEAQRAAQTAYSQDKSLKIRLADLGIQQKKAAISALSAEAKLKNGGLSTHEVHQYTADAALIAQNAFGGFTDSKGNVHPKLTYQQAMKEMVLGVGSHGSIPISIAQKALASAGYAPGVRGAPIKPALPIFPTVGGMPPLAVGP